MDFIWDSIIPRFSFILLLSSLLFNNSTNAQVGTGEYGNSDIGLSKIAAREKISQYGSNYSLKVDQIPWGRWTRRSYPLPEQLQDAENAPKEAWCANCTKYARALDKYFHYDHGIQG